MNTNSIFRKINFCDILATIIKIEGKELVHDTAQEHLILESIFIPKSRLEKIARISRIRCGRRESVDDLNRERKGNKKRTERHQQSQKERGPGKAHQG